MAARMASERALVCLVVGAVGRAFSVAVRPGATVRELQAVIQLQTSRPGRADVELFAAHRGDAWLTAGSDEADNVSFGVLDAADALWMRPLDVTRPVDDYFANAPVDGVIHVLVVVPQDRGDSAKDLSVDILSQYLLDEDDDGVVSAGLIGSADSDLLNGLGDGGDLAEQPAMLLPALSHCQAEDKSTSSSESTQSDSLTLRRHRAALSARRQRTRKKVCGALTRVA